MVSVNIFFAFFISCIFVFAECGIFDTVGYYITSIDMLNDRNDSSLRCEAMAANFGDTIDGNFFGCVVPTIPEDACSPLQSPFDTNGTSICPTFIALIVRGGGANCTFSQKVFNAQQAKFKCALIYDNKDEELFRMDGSGDNIYIPSFLINQRCGLTLKNNFTVSDGYEFMISKYTEMDWAKYLIPFVAVFGLCFLITLIALIIKLVRDRRKELRRRLSKRKLKKIPTRKYKKNETPETCPICLEDFTEGEKLRVLPCKHWYHLKCVDPWLTKNRKVCPVCKRKVLPDEPDSSDSEGERQSASSERRPLLSTNSPDTYGSVASYPDGEMLPEGEYLSAPSTPDSGSPSSARRETPIVLGFTAVRQGSEDPSTSRSGFNNPIYENSEESSSSKDISENHYDGALSTNTSEDVCESLASTSIVLPSGKRENIV